MTKRVFVTMCAAFAALAAGAGPAAADSPTRSGADWACVAVMQLDMGYCQGNPLPDELPVPDQARVLPPK